MAREDEEVLLTPEDAEAMPAHQLVFGDRLYLGECVLPGPRNCYRKIERPCRGERPAPA